MIVIATAKSNTTDSLSTPRWLHIWAIVTVLAALPPLLLGAQVTSTASGMVDPDAWSHVREPWIVLRQWQEGSLLERGLAYVIEHSHRLAGIVIGLCAIILALGLVLRGGRPLLRVLGPLALLAVIVQGMLGIFRVHLHALLGTNLALIHGLTAQLVLALLVSIAVLTAPGWGRSVVKFDGATSVRLRWLALSVVNLIYLQLALGAFLRHTPTPLASRLHLLTAFVVTAGIAWLLREWHVATVKAGNVSEGRDDTLAHASGSHRSPRGEQITAAALALFLCLQLFLGLEAFLSKFQVQVGYPAEPLPPLFDPALARSLHYLFGAAVFSSAVAATLLIFRRGPAPVRELTPSADPVRELEGVA